MTRVSTAVRHRSRGIGLGNPGIPDRLHSRSTTTQVIGNEFVTGPVPSLLGEGSAGGHVVVGTRVPAPATVSVVRVAVVTESFLPQVNGVTNSVLHVIAHLRRRGHEALVLAPGAGPDEVDGVPVIRVPALDLAVVDSLPVGVPTPAVRATLEEYRPDVVHLASPFVLGARAITAARRLRGPDGRRLPDRRRRVRRVVRRRSDRPGRVALDPSAARPRRPDPRPVGLGGRGPRGPRHPPGAPVGPRGGHRPVPATGRARRRRERPPRRCVASWRRGARCSSATSGASRPRSRWSASRRWPTCPASGWSSSGTDPARERLTGLLPGAAFLGFRGGDELATAYAALDAFVHTGPFETFCQAVQEAKAAGLPVLAPDAGGARDLVEPGVTGWLFDTASEQAGSAGLCESVRAWRDDPGLRRRMGHAARASTRGRTWPAVCDELLGHYAELVGTADDSRGAHHLVTRGSAERRPGPVDTAA